MAAAAAAAATAYSADQVVQPLLYAEEVSYKFAGGDNEDRSGWSECKEVENFNGLVGMFCEGTRSIEVDDGQLVHVNYFCEFQFEVNEKGRYRVAYALCQ